MGLEDYITVQLKIGTRLKTIKMEKGTSFKNNSGIFTAAENDKILKVTNYQLQLIKAVANNYSEDGNEDAIILSKKDIDIAIKKLARRLGLIDKNKTLRKGQFHLQLM